MKERWRPLYCKNNNNINNTKEEKSNFWVIVRASIWKCGYIEIETTHSGSLYYHIADTQNYPSLMHTILAQKQYYTQQNKENIY